MWKLLIFQDGVTAGSGVQTRCYMFEFNTKDAMVEAYKFYIDNGCRCKWVRDENNNDR